MNKPKPYIPYGTGICYSCNEVGHFARECPKFIPQCKDTNIEKLKELSTEDIPNYAGIFPPRVSKPRTFSVPRLNKPNYENR